MLSYTEHTRFLEMEQWQKRQKLVESLPHIQDFDWYCRQIAERGYLEKDDFALLKKKVPRGPKSEKRSDKAWIYGLIYLDLFAYIEAEYGVKLVTPPYQVEEMVTVERQSNPAIQNKQNLISGITVPGSTRLFTDIDLTTDFSFDHFLRFKRHSPEFKEHFIQKIGGKYRWSNGKEKANWSLMISAPSGSGKTAWAKAMAWEAAINLGYADVIRYCHWESLSTAFSSRKFAVETDKSKIPDYNAAVRQMIEADILILDEVQVPMFPSVQKLLIQVLEERQGKLPRKIAKMTTLVLTRSTWAEIRSEADEKLSRLLEVHTSGGEKHNYLEIPRPQLRSQPGSLPNIY